jgi:septum formation protein
MWQLVLASQSPRRRELLKEAGFEFQVFPIKVSEIIDENLTAEANASQIATLKARACAEQNNQLKSGDYLILSADTMVVLGERVLGKPKNFSEACEFLRLLSGKTHRVITGVALLPSSSTKVVCHVEITEVTFRNLSEDEIAAYVGGGEPMDKAGAYAIQGEGSKFVSSFSGSWSNVVGLPIEKLEKVLSENGWTVGRRASQTSS